MQTANTPAPVTAETHRMLRALGFVPHYDHRGVVVFTIREDYERLVLEGKIEPGTSVQ